MFIIRTILLVIEFHISAYKIWKYKKYNIIIIYRYINYEIWLEKNQNLLYLVPPLPKRILHIIYYDYVVWLFLPRYFIKKVTRKKNPNVDNHFCIQWLKMLVIIRKIYFVVSVIAGDPEFTEPIVNVTVPAGRSVKLGCSVRNLGSYKVRYLFFFHRKSNTCLILQIGTHTHTLHTTNFYIYIFFPPSTETRIHYFDWTRREKKHTSLHTLSHYLDFANQLYYIYMSILFYFSDGK